MKTDAGAGKLDNEPAAALEGDWNAAQQRYWDEIAPDYDGLYETRWSLAENEAVAERLSWISGLSKPAILDLGCGTGLMYRLCLTTNSSIDYLGVDISPSMISLLQTLYPEAPSRVGTIDDLSDLNPDSYDVVLAAFTAMSYAARPRQALQEIHRVLKPGGRVLLSVINRSSLRRLLARRRGELEFYSTRGSDPNNSGSTPSWTFTFGEVKALTKSVGFADVSVRGAGFLSGVLERPALWGTSELLTHLFPLWCHTLEVEAKKED